jgi:hypothetical protein
MRCYGLAEYIKNSNNTGNEDNRNNFLNSDPIYTARNEAMKALEDYIKNARMESISLSDSTGRLPKDLIKSYDGAVTSASKCLDACVACDYSKPAIKELVEKIWANSKTK